MEQNGAEAVQNGTGEAQEVGLHDLMVMGLRGLEAQLGDAREAVKRLEVEIERQRGAMAMIQQIKDDAALQEKFLGWLTAE